jgi:superfamily II DNA/RNA helicase
MIGIIHGGYNQYERNDILMNFKSGKTRILITTDILSRGIDIQQISLVINYDIPFKVEPYLHRIGRSGRFGRKGCAINLVTYDDASNLKKIERYYETLIEPLPMNFIDIIK